MASKLLVATSLPLSVIVLLPAFAGGVRNVSIDDALNGRVPIIVAAEGGGVNLDFAPTGETIRKIMIDDPSKVVIDHCLVAKGCGAMPEPVIRLIRANIPQANIPAVKTTQLTVLTTNAMGDWSTYIFPVTPSSKPAAVTKFVIGGTTSHTGTIDFATAALGARQAQTQKTLVDPKLKGRVRTYLQLLQGGMPVRTAAQKAKISHSLATRLNQLGDQRASQLAALAKTKTQEAETSIASPDLTRGELIEPPPIASQAPSVSTLTQKNRHASKRSKSLDLKTTDAKPTESSTSTIPPGLKTSSSLPSKNLELKQIPTPVLSEGTQPTPIAAPPNPTQSKPAFVTTTANKPKSQAYAAALLKGLNQARVNKQVSYGSWTWFRVNTAILALRYGDTLEKAISLSKLPAATIHNLIAKGGLR